MRWNENEESPDVIDRRGQGGGGGASPAGLLAFLPFLLRSKLGWLVILGAGALWLISSFFRGGPGDAPSRTPTNGQISSPSKSGRPDDKEAHFAAFVLDDAQTTWTKELAVRGRSYRHTKLVLFTDATQTGCGYGQAATGPFYCPNDERVYIDLGFFKQLSSRFGAKGDFAQAYVVAHEIGHHVQKQLGISDRAHQGGTTKGAEGSSVRLELQADCFAGVWGHSTNQRNLLERGDIDEALTAAQAIGDDRLQKQSSGTVRPETWTHGSSAERQRWFKRGFDSGKLEDCDTFSANNL